MLFNTLRENVDQNKVEMIEINADINSEEFALAAAKKLIELIENKGRENDDVTETRNIETF
jgi:hypothetical protein